MSRECNPRDIIYPVAEAMYGSQIIFAIFALVVQKSSPLPIERGVKLCYLPCREVRVNASEIREVFVSNCGLTKVTILGDPRTVKVRDSRGPCAEELTLTTTSSSTTAKLTTTSSSTTAKSTTTSSSTTSMLTTMPSSTTSASTTTPSSTTAKSTTTPSSTTAKSTTTPSSTTAKSTTASSSSTSMLTTMPSSTTSASTTTPSSTTAKSTTTPSSTTVKSTTTPSSTTVKSTTTPSSITSHESKFDVLKRLIINFKEDDGETLSDKAWGFLAWAIATTLAVGLIVLKKWLKHFLQKHSDTPPSTQPSTETPTCTNPNHSQIPLIQHTPDSQATTPSPISECSITVEPVASRTRMKCTRELKLF
ncbi:uncharacterized protein LOC134252464 [Saccostrea cucullata]|uniref:uncharacterized protein LOC134252464 n=1 Tax=Saccostrea cuccullata TaxID=36930 RepID=UPI002ED21AE3